MRINRYGQNSNFLRFQAIAQRNNYIPSIVRSIAAIHNRSKSFNLRSKVEQIAKISPEEHLRIFQQSSGIDCNPSTFMTSIIKLRLWEISQRKLFNPDAGRRVKPIRLSSNWPSAHKRSSQEILDDGLSQQSSDDLLSDMDHDLLLDAWSTKGSYDPKRVLPYPDLDMLFDEFGSHGKDVNLLKLHEPETKFRSSSLSEPPDAVVDDESDPFLELFSASSGLTLDQELRNPEDDFLELELEDDPFSESLFGPENHIHDEQLLVSDCNMLDFEKPPSESYENEHGSMSEDMLDEQHSPPAPNSAGSDRMLLDGYEDRDIGLHTNGANDAMLLSST